MGVSSDEELVPAVALAMHRHDSGRIAAFDPVTGQFEDSLRDANGAVITIPGLWGIAPGSDGNAGNATALYFAAGGTSEASGVLGNLTALQNPQGNGQ